MSSGNAIFLSYSSDDADAARRICEALRAAGLEVWFDQSELRGGDAWDASIRKQIKECALFVPIISASTNAREEGYFRLEWKLAVDRSHLMSENKAFFVPVILGDVAEPAALVPDRFRERQWSRLNDDASIANFAIRVAKLIDGGGPPGMNAPGTAPMQAFDAVSQVKKAESVPSIAVLAFANRSASADDEYFSDGLADELLSVLAKVKGIRVAARTSAFQFKGKSTDISEIGRRLNVAHLLEGSVRKSGNRVRIGVQLVKVEDGFQLWGETYDRTLDDIFAVQDDIAQSVVQGLQNTLLSKSTVGGVEAPVRTSGIGRAENVEAYRLWLQGKHFFKRGTPGDRNSAVRYFTEATELDPQYAAAWASLSHSLYWHTASGGAEFHIDDYLPGFRRAMSFAERAIALDPDLPEAHVALSYIHGSMSWDMGKGEAAIRRALALAPGDAEVLYHASLHVLVRGHIDEAMQLIERAIELDPLNHQAYTLKGRIFYCGNNFREAEACLRKAMELNPHRWGRGFLTQICLAEGRIDEAATINAGEPTDEYRLLGGCLVQWARGQRDLADAGFASVVERYSQFFAYQIAQGYAFRGDADNVFKWMEACYLQRDPGIHWALMDPLFRPYHGDARWVPMLRRLGFDV